MRTVALFLYFSTLFTHSTATTEEHDPRLPILKSKYLSDTRFQESFIRTSSGVGDGDNEASFIFLQRFPLQGTPFFHTEVLVCPRSEFSESDQKALDSYVKYITSSQKQVSFIKVAEEWWTERTAKCVELGYGGAPCKQKCCGVPHKIDQVNYPINAHRAIIENADVSQKNLYLYGTGDFSGNVAYETICGKASPKCWSNWSGLDYKVLQNNCNTFTSTVLSCVYGLSEEKPDLGVSDLVTVTCKCDPELEFTRAE